MADLLSPPESAERDARVELFARAADGPTGAPAARSDRAGAPDLATGMAALRRQESLLILLNVGVLAGLIVVHAAFAPLMRASMGTAIGLFGGRIAMQLLELAWLRGRFGAPAVQVVQRYARASVWVNVAFAGLASLLSGAPHSHYIVLMVLPTIAAAFRFRWAGLSAVLAVAVGVTFLYVGAYQSLHLREERIDEYFEAATDTLAYLAVAVVVRLLALELRCERWHLQASLNELEQTRDRLVAEEKLAAVGRLSAAIAHEIRNPVGMIASAVATAHQSGQAATTREEMCTIVVQECGRLERLTTDFLSFARQAEPKRTPTSLRTTLDYLAALIQPKAAQRQATVAVDCPVDRDVLIDAALVQQALLNLATNALEAVPAGGTITLGAELGPGERVELFVANSGAPVGAEVRARLCEPFFTTKPRGTGLGLAIARKIARAHGGDLVLTRNEHDRVRFSLVLPSALTGLTGCSEVSHGTDSDCR